MYEDAEISHVVSPQEKVGRTGNKRKRNSRSSHGGRITHPWSVSQTRLKQLLEDQVGRGQVPKFYGRGDISARPLRRNLWSCGQHSYTNPRSGKVANRSGPEEGHEGKNRVGTADLRAHRRRERSSPASSCAPVRLEISWLSKSPRFRQFT